MSSTGEKCSWCGKAGGKLHDCRGTCNGEVLYCNQDCQLKHWGECHHRLCRKIKEHNCYQGNKALVRQSEIVPHSVNMKSKSVTVNYGNNKETFHFSDAKDRREWIAKHTHLAAVLSESPSNGIAAAAQVQLIRDFVSKWGTDKLPARAKKAQRTLTELAFYPQGTVIPLDESS